MPCESCNAQFTVFKRKRPCNECRRLYCSQCLTKRNEKLILCERCCILTTRPLTKTDLQKLKPKDLIFYLQSKHISTTGCVEKDELISLVMSHVNTSPAIRSPTHSSASSFTTNGSQRSAQNSSTTKTPVEGDDNDGDNSANSFDQIKQTCQSLFQSFTSKIAADLNLDGKSTSTGQEQQQEPNISHQPRLQIRKMAPYSSYSQSTPQNSSTNNNDYNHSRKSNLVPNSESIRSELSESHNSNEGERFQPTSTSSSSNASSPIASSISPASALSQHHETISAEAREKNVRMLSSQRKSPRVNGNAGAANSKRLFENVSATDQDATGGGGSGCECSDDEILIKFQKQNRSRRLDASVKAEKTSPPLSLLDSAFEEQEVPGPSGHTIESASSSTTSSNKNTKTLEESSASASSFEELGAVGGNGVPSDNEVWQIVNKAEIPAHSIIMEETQQRHHQYLQTPPIGNSACTSTNLTSQHNYGSLNEERVAFIVPAPFSDVNTAPNDQNPQNSSSGSKLIRRRSDGFICHQQSQARYNPERIPSIQFDEESDDALIIDAGGLRKRSKRNNCTKCGKHKKSLKRYVASFKRQLESTEMSETDMRREVTEFLKFLENRSKESFDCSDPELNVTVSGSGVGSSIETTAEESRSNSENSGRQNPLADRYHEFLESLFLRETDGIHVYGHDTYSADNSMANNRFINLNDFASSDELEELSVKQLKEILMLNRVDFKGCCEKQELLERVYRLWNDLHTTPAIEKLATDDLCKICMDAPIECVILECGHMATCTNCGKVLSECPICRQYIVRVVRFFRA